MSLFSLYKLEDSPSKARIKHLSDKWNNVQSGIEREKQEKRGALEDRLNAIEERVYTERPADEAKFKVIKLKLRKKKWYLLFF